MSKIRFDALGLVACVAALLACGNETRAGRPAGFPTRVLSVDEAQLFLEPGVCSSTLHVSLTKGCRRANTPVEISASGARLATLRGTLRAVDLPLEPRFELKGAGHPTFVRPSSPELKIQGSTLSSGNELAARCETFRVEIECR
ncbi:MAG: hypothetical protein IT377_16405 [Polyangiaceae bacterium]|nr:hypothetical protein [Polyangiaceae bacterium]